MSRLLSNSVRPIAAFGPRRMSKLPDVATLEEQGFVDPIGRVAAWHGISGPAGLPNAIRDRLSALFVEGGRNEAVKRVLDNAGAEPAADWREMTRLIREEGPVIKAMVTELGVRLD